MISAPPLSLSALLLCFFDWARKSNLSGLQNYELIYLAIKPKPFAQPSFYHWKNIKKKKILCLHLLLLYLFISQLFQNPGWGKGYYLLNTFPRRSQHFIEGLHLSNTVLMSVERELCHHKAPQSLLLSPWLLSPPHHPTPSTSIFVSIELSVEGKILSSDV